MDSPWHAQIKFDGLIISEESKFALDINQVWATDFTDCFRGGREPGRLSFQGRKGFSFVYRMTAPEGAVCVTGR